jgi:hypothetical protein
MMLNQEDAVIAELFREQHVINEIAIPQAIAGRPAACGFCTAEQPEPHLAL